MRALLELSSAGHFQHSSFSISGIAQIQAERRVAVDIEVAVNAGVRGLKGHGSGAAGGAANVNLAARLETNIVAIGMAVSTCERGIPFQLDIAQVYQVADHNAAFSQDQLDRSVAF
ncbi:hypothetical protein ALP29_200392 [Pseudomonas syringae pv. avii]|uniref:Uncharacterized protein n=1 Tax=Pseudomonas syringae pv. avii TaxID=663959 RepID=A0A3M5V7T3_PSESX|nr:hypothetical protein ALP29_200392 [Pseudomonas syringae pv. avii]